MLVQLVVLVSAEILFRHPRPGQKVSTADDAKQPVQGIHIGLITAFNSLLRKIQAKPLTRIVIFFGGIRAGRRPCNRAIGVTEYALSAICGFRHAIVISVEPG